MRESGDLVLGASSDDGSQGTSGRLCNLNQVDQAEELYKGTSSHYEITKVYAIIANIPFYDILRHSCCSIIRHVCEKSWSQHYFFKIDLRDVGMLWKVNVVSQLPRQS